MFDMPAARTRRPVPTVVGRTWATAMLALVLVAGCTSAAGSPAPAAASLDPADCRPGNVTVTLHLAPELEAQLPGTVAGRALATWSVRGRCWLEMTASGAPGGVDALLAAVNAGRDVPLDVDNLAYAVAGRVDVRGDPPYFVFGAARPYDSDEIALSLMLFFGGASFEDIANAPNLARYAAQTIAGKDVYVGDASMLGQSEHQRGTPYLYQTETTMFMVVTDDESWAEDAIRQLP